MTNKKTKLSIILAIVLIGNSCNKIDNDDLESQLENIEVTQPYIEENISEIDSPEISNVATETTEVEINNIEEIVQTDILLETVIEVINEETEIIAETNNTDAQIVLNLVNEIRSQQGLSTLTLNNTLSLSALNHSTEMQLNSHFSHEGLNGSNFSQRAIETGYTGSPRGENIARGQRTASAVYNAWINSEGHRANILNGQITDMGLGRSGNYWTQVFGLTR